MSSSPPPPPPPPPPPSKLHVDVPSIDGILDNLRYHRTFYRHVPYGTEGKIMLRNRYHAAAALLSLLGLALGSAALEGELWTVHHGTQWDVPIQEGHEQWSKYQVTIKPGSTTTFGLNEYCLETNTSRICLPHHDTKEVKSTCFLQDHHAGCIQFSTQGDRGRSQRPYCKAIAAVCDYRGGNTKLFLILYLLLLSITCVTSTVVSFELTGWKRAHYSTHFIFLYFQGKGLEWETATKKQHKRAEKAWQKFRRTRVRQIHAVAKGVSIFAAVFAALSSAFWGAVHFQLRKAVDCSSSDGTKGCPRYGPDFILQLVAFGTALMTALVIAAARNKFSRIDDVALNARRASNIMHHAKTRLALAKEIAKEEMQTQAGMMLQAVFRGNRDRKSVREGIGTVSNPGFGGRLRGWGTELGQKVQQLPGGAMAFSMASKGSKTVSAVGSSITNFASRHGGDRVVRGLRVASDAVASGVKIGVNNLGLLPKFKRRAKMGRGDAPNVLSMPRTDGQMCVYCGGNPPIPGSSLCTDCSSKLITCITCAEQYISPSGNPLCTRCRAGGTAGDQAQRFPLFPLDPFSTSELLVPNTEYGNVSSFSEEVEFVIGATSISIFTVPDARPLAEWPLTDIEDVQTEVDPDPQSEMMELLQLRLRNVGVHLFEGDSTTRLARLIGVRQAQIANAANAGAGATASGDTTGSAASRQGGATGIVNGVLARGAKITNGVRLWV